MTNLDTINYEDIKTPDSVEEFRNNLRKYVCNFGGDTIYVQDYNGISIDDISSFSDIYTLTGKGFCGDGTSPNICLKVEWSFDGKGGVREYMPKTKQDFSCYGYWEDKDSQFSIYDIDVKENAMMKLPNLMWATLDNQVLRELYMKMFGEFSDYVSAPLEEVG